MGAGSCGSGRRRRMAVLGVWGGLWAWIWWVIVRGVVDGEVRLSNGICDGKLLA